MKNIEKVVCQYDPACVVQARKSKGYSQEELAFATGLSLRTIQRIEKGHVQPRVYSLKALANSLDCSISDFQQPMEGKISSKEGVINWMDLSIYTVVILPFLPLFLQAIFWYRATELTEEESYHCRQRLHFQVFWLVGLLLTILVQPLVSLVLSGQVSNGDFPLPLLIYLLFVAANLASMFLQAGNNAPKEVMA